MTKEGNRTFFPSGHIQIQVQVAEPLATLFCHKMGIFPFQNYPRSVIQSHVIQLQDWFISFIKS